MSSSLALSFDNRLLGLIISGHLADVSWGSFSDADWRLLIDRAQVEGVAPLVYWAFSQSGDFASLPPSAQNFLRSSYASTWGQNQKNIKELEAFSNLFAQAGIPMVLLKGICFALTIYPDMGLRPMGDMDILVPASKLPDALKIAASLDYSPAKPESSPGLRDLLNHEVCLTKIGEPSTILEIHHSLVADKAFKYAVPTEWFWDQVLPLNATLPSSLPERVQMLTPAAQVLYASSHAMLQHGARNTPLLWYYDLDRLIRHYSDQIDWDLLLKQAGKFEWGSALHAALSQTSAYFNTSIPADVLMHLSQKPDRLGWLVKVKQADSSTGTLEEYQTLLSLNWWGRLRLFLALIVPSPSYVRWRYKVDASWSLPFYYLLRWIGIIKDGFRTVLVLMSTHHRS